MMLPNKVDHEGLAPFPILLRQGSMYNLSADEVNSQFGNMSKPSNTMNLDELVKNVISTEEGHDHLIQDHSSSVSSSSSSSSSSLASVDVKKLDRPLSKKTIEEVWNEIVDRECADLNGNIDYSARRQLTVGETNLEEFLIRAGVLSLGNQQSITNPPPLSVLDPLVLVKQQSSDWIKFDMEHGQGQEQQHQVIFPTPIHARMDASYFPVSDTGFENHPQVGDVSCDLEKQMGIPMEAASSSNPHLETERKRRHSDEMMERSYQRRQRRMIKNRESAARSRARKQAYTEQLEQNVSELKRTNLRLKKRKERGMVLDSNPTSGSRYQLRRTSSALF
ncbi:ABSCISIC ACID-INSENSITIVE 5-like protein 3 [Coffea arabica]|uniref:ABSCISIC ACID-INSENSITIVE 5-like protein 3 n=1 Tax=Coffea arabica TaxID=13443 RepID=A0ABM4W175_COFAR|nr:ABSCISIC ACID-INSENSITIVE 5-like protein 3 [Coffea arabica]